MLPNCENRFTTFSCLEIDSTCLIFIKRKFFVQALLETGNLEMLPAFTYNRNEEMSRRMQHYPAQMFSAKSQTLVAKCGSYSELVFSVILWTVLSLREYENVQNIGAGDT